MRNFKGLVLTLKPKMKKSVFILLLGMFMITTAFAQQTIIKGSVKDAATNQPIPDVTITIKTLRFQPKLMLTGNLVLQEIYR